MNSTAFTPEEVEQNLHLDLIKYLLDYNSKADKYYNDIHITSDGYCTIIEWDHVSYDHDIGGKFEYVDSEHEVLKRVIFPDNHIEYLSDSEEQEAINEFLLDNPEYYKDEYGRWRNKEEDDALCNILDF